jgi:hypothetical protein
MTGTSDKGCRLFFTGDISFSGRNAGNPCMEVFAATKQLFAEADLVVGNLESPLVEGGDPVAGKCILSGHPGWAGVLKQSGIGLVSLANNHLMDFGSTGLFSTMKALEESGIRFVGAGRNQQEANAPIFINVNVQQIAFLARTSVEVSSPCYAEHNAPGVAFLNEDEIAAAIKDCAGKADLVVVLIHWGLEQYHYPSPEQRRLAGSMIKAGANIILGHHPHVLQGVEKINNGLVAYSLGNFLFDEFTWQTHVEDQCNKMNFTLTQQNREGIIFKIKNQTNNLSFKPTFTFVHENGKITIDGRQQRYKDFNRFCTRLNIPFYNVYWKIYAISREWKLRIGRQLSLRKIFTKFYKIRLRHIVQLITSLKKSGKIAAGKSSNPYD